MSHNDDATVAALDELMNNGVGPALDDAEIEGIGADASPGFDWGTLIKAGAEAASQGVKYAEDKKAAEQSSRNSAANAQKAIAADAAWASAEQQLDLAQKSGDSSRVAPAQALQVHAMQAAQSAGAGLDASGQGKRADAANKALHDAASAALADPGNQAKQALSRAWQKVVVGTPQAAAGGSGGGAGGALTRRGGHDGGDSWFMRKWAGLPNIAWIGIGAVALLGLVMLVRSLKRGRHR